MKRLRKHVWAALSALALLAFAPTTMAQAVSTYVNGVIDPFGLDFRPDNSLLISTATSIQVAPPGGGSFSNYFSGGPYAGRGVTVRASDPGAAYGANNNTGRIERFTGCPGGCGAGIYTTAAGGYDIQFDAGDNAFVSLFAGNVILRVASGCVSGCASTVFANAGSDPNLINPAGIVIAANGDLYVASETRILRYAAGCVVPCASTTFATVNAGARGLVFDAVSNAFYVASGTAGGNTIQRISTLGVVTAFAAVPGGGLEGMTLGPDARLYVAAPDLDQVVTVALPHYVVAVPTLSEWALILLGMMLTTMAVARVGVNRRVRA